MIDKPITIRLDNTSDSSKDLMYLSDTLIDAGFPNTINEDKILIHYPQGRLDDLVGIIEEILPKDFLFNITIGHIESTGEIVQYDTVIPFGKYKDRKVEDILIENPNYIIWANKNVKTFNVSKETINKAWDLVKSKK